MTASVKGAREHWCIARHKVTYTGSQRHKMYHGLCVVPSGTVLALALGELARAHRAARCLLCSCADLSSIAVDEARKVICQLPWLQKSERTCHLFRS